MGKTQMNCEFILDKINQGVVVYRPIDDGLDFEIVYINQFVELIEKVDKKIIVGKTLMEIFPGATNIGLLNTLRQVYSTGEKSYLPSTLYEDKSRKGWKENYIYKMDNGNLLVIYNDSTYLREVGIGYCNLKKMILFVKDIVRILEDKEPLEMTLRRIFVLSNELIKAQGGLIKLVANKNTIHLNDHACQEVCLELVDYFSGLLIENKPMIFNELDIQQLLRNNPNIHKLDNFNNMLICPVTDSHGTNALMFYYNKENGFTNYEMEIVRLLSVELKLLFNQNCQKS